MKRRLLILVIFCLFFAGNIFSQEKEKKSLWAEQPEPSVINEENENENLVGIFMHEKYEFFYNPEGELLYFHTMHRRFRLKSDDAINSLNKLSVALANVVEVTEIKARVIKPDGQIIEFDQGNIKEVVDETTDRNFKIFAIDGIENGDDMEYLVIRKMTGGNFGRTFFQFRYPLQKASFELISPKNLLYAAKGYNGFPDPEASTLKDGRNRLFTSMDIIPALKDEKYAYFQPRRARLDYRLDVNLVRGRGQVLTWADAAQRVYEMMYENVDPKAMNRWLRMLRIRGGTPLEQAAKVEEYIKSNIYIQEYHMPEFNDLDFIRSKKVTSERGVVRLYVNLFKALGINHEVVLTSGRSEVLFDPDFQSWNYLDKYLIYLPEEDSYIDPIEDFYRIGCVEGETTATYGLFVSLLKIGDFETAIGRIKYIEPAPFDANYDSMNIEISLDLENQQAKIINTRGFKGLSGGYFGRIYKVLDAQRKQDFLKNLMETKAPNPNYNDLKVLEKADVDFMGDAEFIIYADFTSTSFVELAGDRILLKIGESIGPQVELYYEQEREIGGESGFNRWYYRRIIFRVPEGFQIMNPEAADMRVTEENNGEIIFAFFSTHKYSGNEYIIDIDEYYKQIQIAPNQFEGFRKVINAAADFNKVVLVLEKK